MARKKDRKGARQKRRAARSQTKTQIFNKSRSAKRGQKNARKDLIALNDRLIAQVNRELKTIKKKNLPSAAAKILKQKGRLKRGRNLSNEDIRKQILDMQAFLRSKTGTAKGAKEYAEKEIKRLREAGIDMDIETFMGEWADFLSTEAFKEFKKYDSERAIMEGMDALKSGKTLEDLKDLWEMYQRKEITMMEVWNTWRK